MGQEIERKWRVRTLPKDYRSFPCKEMEQAYLCVNPTLRIRKEIFSAQGVESSVEKTYGEENSVEKKDRKAGEKDLEEKGIAQSGIEKSDIAQSGIELSGIAQSDIAQRDIEQGEEYIFCYKGKGRLSREEYNLPLTKEAYESLHRKIEGRVIRKSRYEIPCGKYTVELDVFHGGLEGLCYAEVEFSSLEEAKNFQPLDWFSEELTEERGYSNAELSFAKDLSGLKLKD